MPNNLKFREKIDGIPDRTGISHRNPDKKGYATIEELELGETNLKFKLRKIVAYVLIGCAAIILFVFLWHTIMPESWRWLPEKEVISIKNLALTLFGALAMSIATLFYTKK